MDDITDYNCLSRRIMPLMSGVDNVTITKCILTLGFGEFNNSSQTLAMLMLSLSGEA